VVVNPSSFAEFDEYKDTYDNMYCSKTSASQAYHDRLGSELTFYDANSNVIHDVSEPPDDPDVIILKVFEDDARAKAVSPALVSHQGPIGRSPSFSQPSSTNTLQWDDSVQGMAEQSPLLRRAHKGGRDHYVIHYYRRFVHRHLTQVHRDSLGNAQETGAPIAPDILERQAATFLPVSCNPCTFDSLLLERESSAA